MAYKLTMPAPHESMRTYYNDKGATAFLDLFEKEIYIQDTRSKTMPSLQIGLIIGIMLDKILIRVNNDMTKWYPLRHSEVKLFL